MRVNRRRLLTGGAAALAAGAVVTASGVANSAVVDHGFGTDAEPFYGPHRPGSPPPHRHTAFSSPST